MFGKRGALRNALTGSESSLGVKAVSDIMAKPPGPAAVGAPAAATSSAALAVARPPARALDSRRSDSYYDIKSSIFNALIDAIDLTQLGQLDGESARDEIRDIVNEIIALKDVVMSIAEQEELLEDICNDVLGYGRSSRCWRA